MIFGNVQDILEILRAVGRNNEFWGVRETARRCAKPEFMNFGVCAKVREGARRCAKVREGARRCVKVRERRNYKMFIESTQHM